MSCSSIDGCFLLHIYHYEISIPELEEDGQDDPPSRKSCYNFRVTSIDKVLDGDTIDVTIDLGFDL